MFDAISLQNCVDLRLTHGAPGAAALEKVIALHERSLREMQIGMIARQARR